MLICREYNKTEQVTFKNRGLVLKEVLIITVVCWNIQYGKNFDRILSVMKNDLRADTYILQEVDKNTSRTGFRDIAKELAADLGINYKWGKEFRELDQGSSSANAYTGQAVLSKYNIKLLKNLYFQYQPVDWSPSLLNPRSWFEPRYGKRMAQIVELTVANEKIIIANAHLESGLVDKDIAPQMEELVEYLDNHHPESLIIVAGDFNTLAGSNSPVIKILEKQGFKNTSKKRLSGKNLDWIFYRGNRLSVSRDLVIRKDIKAADHSPLVTKIKITPR